MNSDAAIHLPSCSTERRADCPLQSLLPASRREWPPKIFRHLPAVFEWPGLPIDEAAAIAKLFYEQCYTRPEIFDGPTLHPQSSLVFKSSDFVERITRHRSEKHRNHLSYLIGNVGSGKTAYINYLLTRFGNDLYEQKKILFLRVDLEKTYELNGRARITRGTVLIKVISKLLELFARFPQLQEGRPAIARAIVDLREVWNKAVDDYAIWQAGNAGNGPAILHLDSAVLERGEGTWYFPRLENAFVSFIDDYHKATGRRLLLILDNVDVVAHMDDRAVFTGAGETALSQSIQGIIDFLRQFVFGAGPMDSLGACVLTVMRRDTYKILSLPLGVSFTHIPEADLGDAFTFASVPWKEVLESRLKLAALAANLLGGGRGREVQRVAQRMSENLCTRPVSSHTTAKPRRNPQQVIETLNAISSFGHRGMVSYFSHFAEMHPQHAAAGRDRLEYAARYEATALLSFFLRNNLWFSQQRSQFPNLYLINVVDGQHIDHRPSYWLKRLILEMLWQKGDSRFAPRDILHTFAGNGGAGFYERPLVELALGSMADVECSNLLALERNRPPGSHQTVHVDAICLNKRAKRCMEEVFDSFVYLQVVIDDEWMHFPKSVQALFTYSADQPTYAYLASDDGAQFAEGAHQMIHHKSYRVLLFLLILEEALIAEEKAFPSAFAKLREHDVVIPDVKTICKNVRRHVRGLYRHFGLDQFNGLSVWVESYRDLVRRDLANAFQI